MWQLDWSKLAEVLTYNAKQPMIFSSGLFLFLFLGFSLIYMLLQKKDTALSIIKKSWISIFALPGAKATSMDDIKNFDTLKAVVEDMTAHKDDLGIDGVFASTSFAPGEDWRWQTHLMNLPIYYEYKDANVKDEDEITFKYNENYKNIFDLYLNNSTVEPTMVGSKT